MQPVGWPGGAAHLVGCSRCSHPGARGRGRFGAASRNLGAGVRGEVLDVDVNNGLHAGVCVCLALFGGRRYVVTVPDT